MSTNTWERPPVITADVEQRSEGHAEVAARTGRPLSGTVDIDGAGPAVGSAPVQTFQGPPSIGLARMALRLACHRVYRDSVMSKYIVLDVRGARGPVSANAEYYSIIDRISRGEKP